MCNANIITEHDSKRPGLSSAPLDVEHDNNSRTVEQSNLRIAIYTHNT